MTVCRLQDAKKKLYPVCAPSVGVFSIIGVIL